uniref:Uncharacterized protein n=1 Tax=Haemonchus contortus TaxID=6289 RepID=A0A7I4Y3C7_HAECO
MSRLNGGKSVVKKKSRRHNPFATMFCGEKRNTFGERRPATAEKEPSVRTYAMKTHSVCKEHWKQWVIHVQMRVAVTSSSSSHVNTPIYLAITQNEQQTFAF